jgi:hypothetical protein
MASGPKPCPARARSVRSACCSPAIASKRSARLTQCAACPAWIGGLLVRPMSQRSQPWRSTRATLWSVHGLPDSRWCAHRLPPRCDRQRAAMGRSTARSSPRAPKVHGEPASHGWKLQFAMRKAGDGGAELTGVDDDAGAQRWGKC